MAETLKYVNASGTELVLSSGDITWMYGMDGRGLPPVALEETANRIGAGSVLTLLRSDARTLPIPVMVTGDLRTVLRAASVVLNPELGDGRLVSQVDAAAERELVCRYVGGLQWTEDQPFTMRQVISFRAFDPFWQDTADVTDAWVLGTLGNWLPWLPVRALVVGLFAEAVVDNTGDVEAWPVWTITGPTTDVTLENVTSGRSLKVAVALTSAETLTIDTRPAAKTVVDQAGTNRFATLDAAVDDLFPFVVGTNNVNITITGGDDSTTEVALAWRRRWLTV
jgi:hypothetical protein